MKKLLISIGSLAIMAVVVILFINATQTDKDPKKAKTESAKTEVTAPCSAACNHSTGEKPATCEPTTCTVHKDGKCDPATCTAHKEGDAMGCNHTGAGCQGTCHAKTPGDQK
ncbi:MAG: hypothetical protein V1903_10150 [Bacteroidota bacterium]